MSHEHYLRPLFEPKSIALAGATEREGALGRFVFERLGAAGFAGPIYPVNPKHDTVFGVPCYPALTELPTVPELLVITTPAATVPGLLTAAAALGIRHVLLLSAGFAETDDEGKRRAAQCRDILTTHGMRLIGPNCIGLMRPAIGFDATFASVTAKPGALALVSQSGAVCTAILDWAATTEIGFSSVVSLGGALDIDYGEVLDYLVHDPATRSILLYVEGIRDARGFLSALRAAARVKPVIIYKAGRHAAGSLAVTSHTAALAGDDAVFDAALARAGAVRVRGSLQLFAAARMLASEKRPVGNRLAIVTNGGGPGVVAADCVMENQLALANLSEATVRALDEVLPSHWSHRNPIDIIGDAPPMRFAAAADAALRDEGVDALLVLFCPQAVTTPEAAAEALIRVAQTSPKCVVTAWLGGASIQQARALLEHAHIPNFLTPENAVESISYLVRFRQHQTQLLQSAAASGALDAETIAIATANACAIRNTARAAGRTLLSPQESLALLAAFGIVVPSERVAHDRDSAVAAAQALGFPVALKILSATITHKTDVGGVRLQLANSRQVANAFDEMLEAVSFAAPDAAIDGVLVQKMMRFPHQREAFAGLKRDAVFGPVIAFGSGGIAVEAIGDVALSLPPINPTLAKDVIRATRISRTLAAYRDVPAVDHTALEDILVRLSMMACLLPWLHELDLNPILSHPTGAMVVDARAVIDHASPDSDPRYQHMAIFPYPVEREHDCTLRDGALIHIRPIRPDDADRERAFMAQLSDASRYARFQHPVSALSDEMIARFTQIDYDREMALVATIGAGELETLVGVARYFPNPDRTTVEFAIAIADAWQGRGLGGTLMEDLIACARDAGCGAIEGAVLSSNTAMLNLAVKLGFATLTSDDPNHTHRVALTLLPAGETPYSTGNSKQK